MQRDINAKLGQGVRELLGQTPYDHRALMNLYQEAEEEQAELQMLLREGFEAEAAQLKTSFMHAALNHPDELWFQDPTEEVRERIKSDPQTKSSESYCSPVLVETLLWEGMEGLPNTHRRKLELDFPDRVEALLDFHCIAFHADVNVLKELYDDDVLSRKADKVEVLARHQAKMNRLMVSFAKDMNERWAEQTERMRARALLPSHRHGGKRPT
ncbi:hypothetical protein K438DRAFT_931035 [Mycena galopus ATCC 62051]|nr:hypothetical protein K438DRAFT_931035 [Mycena galopus ATCC 62051]